DIFAPPPARPPPAPPRATQAPTAPPAGVQPAAAAPVEALFVDRASEPELHVHEPVATAPAEEQPVAQPDPPAPVARPEPQTAGPAPTPTRSETNPELLRLLEVVTTRCDDVTEYTESAGAEGRVMLEPLATLGRAITDSAAALASRTATATAITVEAAETRAMERPEPRERVI